MNDKFDFNKAIRGKPTDVLKLHEYFPHAGECAFCGFHDKRHRLWDMIIDRHKGGDSIEMLADDYRVPKEAIELVLKIRPYQD